MMCLPLLLSTQHSRVRSSAPSVRTATTRAHASHPAS